MQDRRGLWLSRCRGGGGGPRGQGVGTCSGAPLRAAVFVGRAQGPWHCYRVGVAVLIAMRSHARAPQQGAALLLPLPSSSGARS